MELKNPLGEGYAQVKIARFEIKDQESRRVTTASFAETLEGFRSVFEHVFRS